MVIAYKLEVSYLHRVMPINSIKDSLKIELNLHIINYLFIWELNKP